MLVHLPKKLLKNSLRSTSLFYDFPLKPSRKMRSILFRPAAGFFKFTCHHIHSITHTATGLWQEENSTSDRHALLVIARSQGNLWAIIADLLARGDRRGDHA